MTKSELMIAIANKRPDFSEKTIAIAVNEIIEQMSETLSIGGRIEIRGFGSFVLHFHAQRDAHNPKTGAKIITPAKYTPRFKPGNKLKDRVNAARAHNVADDVHED